MATTTPTSSCNGECFLTRHSPFSSTTTKSRGFDSRFESKMMTSPARILLVKFSSASVTITPSLPLVINPPKLCQNSASTPSPSFLLSSGGNSQSLLSLLMMTSFSLRLYHRKAGTVSNHSECSRFWKILLSRAIQCRAAHQFRLI